AAVQPAPPSPAIAHRPAPAIPQVAPAPAAHHGILYEPVQQFNKFVQSIPGGEENLQKLSNWSDEKREETLRDWDLTRSPDQALKNRANGIPNEGIPLPAGGSGAIQGMASHIHEAEELEQEAQKFRYLTPREVAEAAPGTNFKKLGSQGAADFNQANPRA